MPGLSANLKGDVLMSWQTFVKENQQCAFGHDEYPFVLYMQMLQYQGRVAHAALTAKYELGNFSGSVVTNADQHSEYWVAGMVGRG